MRASDYVAVIGGGPIGTLIALVARAAGARVLVSEVNPFRLALARELGIETIHPGERDLTAYVNEQTGGAGADVVFEVSASAAGAAAMTELARTRGRIVVVGIFSQPPQVNVHRVFWRGLTLIGARVYEREDFDRAIELAASGALPLDRLITDVRPLDQLGASLEQMDSGGEVMKILLQVEPAA